MELVGGIYNKTKMKFVMKKREVHNIYWYNISLKVILFLKRNKSKGDMMVFDMSW